ncbi:DUF2683 domain-containing protein [Candidatus Woesearchaeota archaeon]|nr:DUF2683 domain-containing protein [Candidatus Woesearchaeota archaeon]
MVFARINLNEYSNRVLNVIKAKFGLETKSEAINKFAELYGDSFVEKEMKEKEIRDLINTCNRHFAKYGRKKMSLKELDRLCGM